MNNEFSIAAHWPGGFDEAGLRDWAEDLRRQLPAPQVSLGLVFMSPKFFPHAKAVLEILRVHARIPLLAGCSSAGLIAGPREFENAGGLALALYSLPGAELKGVHFTQAQVEEAHGAYWHLETGVEPKHTNGWLVFIDPFHLDSESWMRGWNEAYAPVPAFGGLASGAFSDPTTQVYLNGDVFEDGGVAVSVGGGVKLEGVISQGCTPIGESWTLTRVEKISSTRSPTVLPTPCSMKRFKNFHPPNSRRRAATSSSAWSSTNTSRIFIAAIFSCVISSAAIRIPACWRSARCRGRGR